MECIQCGGVLLEGQASCSICGAKTPQHRSGMHEEVEHLLAEANLLRLRKQSNEAISVCTRVLRLDPQNATAHALMGDIHRDEGNFREAMGWFKLAAQLEPNNTTYRKKLDDSIDKVFKGAQAEQDFPDLNLAAALPHAKSSGNMGRVREFIEKVTPLHVIITFCVLGVLAFVFFLTIDAQRANTMTKKPVTPVTDQQPPAPQLPAPTTMPTVTPPNPDSVESGKIPGLPVVVVPGDKNSTAPTPDTTKSAVQPPTTTNTTTPATPTTQVPPFEPQVRNRMTEEELQKQTDQLQQMLENELKTSKLPSTLNGVTIDPRTNIATFFFVIPHMKGPVDTKQGLLYTGFKLIWSTEKVTTTMKAYTLRGYAYPETGNIPTLALLADVSPQQADDAREAGDYRTVSKYLSNAWWRGDLDAAQL